MAENIENDDNELVHNDTVLLILQMVACTKDNRDWLHSVLDTRTVEVLGSTMKVITEASL